MHGGARQEVERREVSGTALNRHGRFTYEAIEMRRAGARAEKANARIDGDGLGVAARD
jgi:hypothetical protein